MAIDIHGIRVLLYKRWMCYDGNDYNKITSIITAIDIIYLSDLFYVEQISVSQEIQVKQSYL